MRLLLFLLMMGFAASLFSQTTLLVGEWKGTSICQLKNSPCHDEVVVYKISSINQKDSIALDAYKIIDGKEDFMGRLDFKYNESKKTMQCLFKENWLWLFSISGDKMEGTLTRISDNTLYRKISVSKTK